MSINHYSVIFKVFMFYTGLLKIMEIWWKIIICFVEIGPKIINTKIIQEKYSIYKTFKQWRAQQFWVGVKLFGREKLKRPALEAKAKPSVSILSLVLQYRLLKANSAISSSLYKHLYCLEAKILCKYLESVFLNSVSFVFYFLKF